jgi:hypothetical protein
MARPLQGSIFGGAELARPMRTSTERAQGYSGTPGLGPEGQTCGTCVHCVRKAYGDKHWYKCDLNRVLWTASRTTDILLGSPACELFKESETPVQLRPGIRKKRKPKPRKSLPERIE